MVLLLQLLANGLVRGSIYALVALGFALIYRGARDFHVAHGAVYTGAAYALYGSYVLLHLSLQASVFLALSAAVVMGLVCEVAVYAPLHKRRASSAVVIVSSLALYIIMVNCFAVFFGNETRIVFQQVSPSYPIGPIILTETQIFEFVISSLAILTSVAAMNFTHSGILVQALSDNPKLSEALGFNVRGIRLFIYFLGSLLAGIAAVLVSSDVGVQPWRGMDMLLSAAVAVIIGGVGVWSGAIVGGFFLGLVQAFAIWQLSAAWQTTVTFVLLILFLLFRPQGILGKHVRVEEK